MKKIGNNLKQILNERGLKSKFVADKLSISQSYFSSIIKGNHIPSIEVALKLERILQMSISKIFYIIPEAKEDGKDDT